MDYIEDGNTPRKVKTVRFNEEPEVFIIETLDPNYVYGSSIMSTTRRSGSIRQRAKKYDERVSRRPAPQQPRPPALPPRNPVQEPVARAAQEPPAPQPPPRARNKSNCSAVLRQTVRVFRRDPDARPVAHRLKVPDTPPPPPPSFARNGAETPNHPAAERKQSATDDEADDDAEHHGIPGCSAGCLLQ